MLIILNEIRCSIIDVTRSCLAELAQASRVNDFNISSNKETIVSILF